ncbi:MAG: type II toxin-antitoxin system RelE/ParE family toxin [Methylobacteriaceae bacterium]|nr:type II toxin-antitoxin system RelE/ParE family toxin [Methylobacteriaceae bacterium]
MKSFKDKKAEKLFEHGVCPSEWRGFRKAAERKLDMLDGAAALRDLRNPPGNRLEALRGDRRGQYSIRINDQYRLCFRWIADGPDEVEIVDYH